LNIFLGARVLAFPLAIAFITTSTLDSWDVPTSFFGVVTFPSQYLPYALLLITLICSGPEGALIHATGLAGAHLYEVLTGAYAAEGGPSRNFIQAPEFLKKVCGTRTEVSRPYGTVLNAAGPSGAATSAWGVGWGKWGKGQRLGGDVEGAAPVERERSNIVKVVIVVVFVVTACGLGVLFMMHRDPEGWWTTLRGALFGGDMSSTTTPPKDPGLVKNPAT
jgi:Derlin-2/3